MATRKKDQQPEVRNLVVLRWVDDDGEVQEYEKRLKRPKGRQARTFMPKVLNFLGEVADRYASIENEEAMSAQTTNMISQFFTEENEELFVYILQVEDDPEGKRILDEEMNNMDLLDAVVIAAQYLVSESLNRSEVQQALKKSSGDAAQVEEEPASS